MNQKVPSVTDLISAIKKNLEGGFRNVTVVGEVTNLSHSSAGHWYLSLSDPNSLLGAAVFKMDAMRNPVIKNLKDGDKVMCTGSISVYPKRGSFQLIIKRIVPIGKGDLKDQFEKLKKKLAGEGLFDLSSKTKIPDLPKRIAVITALRGAALQDFLNIIKRRSHFMDIMVVPALVQGDAAPGSIRRALEATIRFHLKHKEAGNLDKLLDVIVLTRGGGSLEDLWAFNDEALAWDIFNCPIPTVSAVGHQVDYSISDYVADLRCETPSAAAEILTNTQKNIVETLENSKKHLVSSIRQRISKEKYDLSQKSPRRIIEELWKKLHSFQSQVEQLNPVVRKYELIPYQQYEYELDMKVERLKKTLLSSFESKVQKLERNKNLLDAMNPKNVLSRGYAYTEIDGKVLSSAEDFEKVDSSTIFKVHYSDGHINATKAL
ncbi:MAG: exodeoxyribonuclease VII large subunit [Bacteriovorax sp. MedPE-SWde]|nr:MAG: exodeoxyribonuclease VII large subunit [Bacteriovorax sp. MedPE-SWde]